jgi:glycosyltransferase 2 family protein
MKKNLQMLLKILISFTFLFLVFRKIDASALIETIRGCYLPLAVVAVIITVLLSFLLALRWLILLKEQTESNKFRYLNLWKLTMVGILFNNFLPTGAGGDIAKVFFLVKGEEKKLLIGSSVLVDRFIGALTVITMGAIATLFTSQVNIQTRWLIYGLLTFLLVLLLFFAKRRVASVPYSLIKKILPDHLRANLENTYGVFNKYLSSGKSFLQAMGVSFLLQSISIFSNYLISLSLLWKQESTPDIGLFYTYIPLIWTATLIPSLGGLGIREFTYVYFFSAYMGEEKAFALSILFLLTILVQSIIGVVILLFLRASSEKR